MISSKVVRMFHFFIPSSTRRTPRVSCTAVIGACATCERVRQGLVQNGYVGALLTLARVVTVVVAAQITLLVVSSAVVFSLHAQDGGKAC